MGFEKLSVEAQNLINAYKVRINNSDIGDKKLENETEAEKAKLQEMIDAAFDNGKLSNQDYLILNNQTVATEVENDNKSDATKSQVVTNPQAVADNRSKSDVKYAAKDTKEFIKNVVKNKDITLSMMMNQWDSYFTVNNNQEKAEIGAMISAMGDYSTKVAIANLDKTVRRNLGKNMTKLQRDVLADMVELAKRENIVNAATQLCNQYEQIKYQAGVDGKALNYAELYNETAHQATGNEYLNEAALVLKNQYITRDAYTTYLGELRAIRQEGKLTETEDIIAALNKKYANDKVMLEVIKANEKVYNNNHKEGPADIVARGNKSDERQLDLSKIQGREDLNELKRTNPKLEYKVWSYLNQDENKNEDGTYNMDKLYQIVKDRSGYDHFSNQSRFQILDEMNHIREDAGFEKLHLTKGEEKQLLEFMDRKYAKNTHYWSDVLGTTDNAVAAGAGAVAALPGITKNVINVTFDINTLGLSETLGNQVAQDLAAAINEGGAAAGAKASVGGFGSVHVFINDVSWTGVVGALTAPAAAALFTILCKHAIGQAPDENPCTNLADDLSKIKEECGDDPERLKAYIAKRHSAKATDTLGKLIDTYKVMNKGEFSTDKFVTLVTKMGGSGSLANCQELLGGYFEAKVPEIEVPETPEKPEDPENNPVDPEYNLNIRPEEKEEQVCYNTHDIKKGDTWSTIINTYYKETLDKYGWKTTLAALRKALGSKSTDTDLPYLTRIENGRRVNYLELPCELLDVKNHMGDLDANRQKYNTNNFATNVTKSQGVSYVGVKRSVSGFYAWDNDNKDAQGNPKYYWGNTPEEAVTKLEAETKKTYKNRDEKIAEFAK